MKRFSELTGQEKALELLRWLCVPLVAALGVVAVGMFAGAVISPILAQLPGTLATPPSDFQRFVLHRMFGVLMGLAFVIGGALTAPRGHTITAVVLAALWILYAFLMHVAVHWGRGKTQYIDFALAVIATGAATWIIYSMKSKGSGTDKP